MTSMWIGFDRTIRRHWLDQTALLAHDLRDDRAIYDGLMARLATDIAGVEARKKTMQALMRVWWRVPAEHVTLRDEALALAANVSADDRLLLHWGMLLVVYPIFRDTSAIVGRLLRLQSDFQLAQVSQRLAGAWGSNATLHYVVPRILRSWRDWNVVQAADDKGRYTAASPVRATEDEPQLLLLDALLRSRGGEIPIHDMLTAPELFPFALSLSTGQLRRASRFQVESRSQDLVAHHTASVGCLLPPDRRVGDG